MMAIVDRMSGMTVCQGLILVTIALSVVLSGTEGSPHHRDFELDPTDICLFACDSCFKGDTLVRCANECIVLGGDVGPLMRARCPNFEQNIPPIFSGNVNK